MRIKNKNISNLTVELMDCRKLSIFYSDKKEFLSWPCDSDVDIIESENLFWPVLLTDTGTGKKIRARYFIESHLIPKHKFDFEAIEKIEKADKSEIEPVLPMLFEWTEDINWPIAEKLAEALVRLGEIIVPYVIHYLRHPNGLDEYSVYYSLIPLMKKEHLEMLRDEFENILKNTSDYQKSNEYDVFALKYLIKLNFCNWDEPLKKPFTQEKSFQDNLPIGWVFGID